VIFVFLSFQEEHHHQQHIDDDVLFLGVSASPPVSGSKSAAESRVAAKLQKELPPVALLQQRHIGFRPCGLSAYNLTPRNLHLQVFVALFQFGRKHTYIAADF